MIIIIRILIIKGIIEVWYQYDNYNQNFDNQRDYRGIQEENTKTSKWKQMMGDKKKSKRELDEIINKHQNRFKKYK